MPDLKRDLRTMLRESDPWLLPLFAKTWGVSVTKLTGDKLINTLAEAMLEPARAEKVYNALDDKQRDALKVLHGYKGRMMSAPMFEMIYQPVRPLSKTEVADQNPHEHPTGPTEGLYYRGFIGRANDKVGKGIGPVFYIPEDLAQVLPLNRTGYDAAALEDYEDDDEELDALGAGDEHDDDDIDDDHVEAEEDESDGVSEFAPPVTRTPRAYEAPSEPSAIPSRPSTPTSPTSRRQSASKSAQAEPETTAAPTREAVGRSASVQEPALTTQVLPVEQVDDILRTNTSVVDDLITLLAFLKLENPEIEIGYQLHDEALQQRLLSYMMVDDPGRLQFMIGIGITSDLITVQSGRLYPHSTEISHWLKSNRSGQLKRLVDAWLDSESFQEVWHTPGLYAETGWSYDAADARQVVMGLLQQNVPRQDWWRVDDFIDFVKVTNPNFQRPGGDYDSWYIKGQDGKYLKGLNSWDAVEGAVLSFYLTGPMYWLGLMDTAEDGMAVHFSGYGRAFIERSGWPTSSEPEERITVQPDGSFLVSRRASSVDRFQLARFTTWNRPGTLAGDPYVYQLDAQGIRQADQQGISVSQIVSFINRLLDGSPAPAVIASLLENWRTGPVASASMERLQVLRTTSPEVMDSICNAPALRRHLGARLGEMAVIVREGHGEDLRDALGGQGIDVSVTF